MIRNTHSESASWAAGRKIGRDIHFSSSSSLSYQNADSFQEEEEERQQTDQPYESRMKYFPRNVCAAPITGWVVFYYYCNKSGMRIIIIRLRNQPHDHALIKTNWNAHSKFPHRQTDCRKERKAFSDNSTVLLPAIEKISRS